MFKSEKAQVVIEMTIAWIVLLVFLMGATGLFIWFNLTLVERQKAYERTRLAAGKLLFDCTLSACKACYAQKCHIDSCSDNALSVVNCYKPCLYTGVCHRPMVSEDGVSGSTFYNPESLKIFKR